MFGRTPPRWKVFATPGQTENRGYPLDELRYPNPEELRYMCFSSIAMGAKGLSFFSYDRSRAVDAQWAERTLPPLLQEINEFAEAIGYPKTEQVDLGEIGDEVIAGLWKNNGSQWLLLANVSAEPQPVSCSFSPKLRSGTLVPWGSTRATDAALKDGILSVDAEPWEIFIWKVN